MHAQMSGGTAHKYKSRMINIGSNKIYKARVGYLKSK